MSSGFIFCIMGVGGAAAAVILPSRYLASDKLDQKAHTIWVELGVGHIFGHEDVACLLLVYNEALNVRREVGEMFPQAHPLQGPPVRSTDEVVKRHAEQLPYPDERPNVGEAGPRLVSGYRGLRQIEPPGHFRERPPMGSTE